MPTASVAVDIGDNGIHLVVWQDRDGRSEDFILHDLGIRRGIDNLSQWASAWVGRQFFVGNRDDACPTIRGIGDVSVDAREMAVVDDGDHVGVVGNGGERPVKELANAVMNRSMPSHGT